MNSKKIALTIIFLWLSACAGPKIARVEPPAVMPPPREIENVQVALVLGGGGAKGIAHLGVLEVLERHNIPLDLIVGTSAGSVVGAMYADYRDSKLLFDNLIKLQKWDLLDFSFLDTLYFFSDLRAPIQGYYMEDFVIKNLTVHNMEDLSIPFVAVATDLENESAFSISSGPIATAVHASSAIPPFFRPVQAYGKLLVDGGVIEPVPVFSALKYNPKMIIAVDISTSGREYVKPNMWDVTLRSMYISYYKLSQWQSHQADILIHPDCTGVGLFDDEHKQHLYNLGRNAAEKLIPEIVAKMKEKGISTKNVIM